jgi:hypothetical protein
MTGETQQGGASVSIGAPLRWAWITALLFLPAAGWSVPTEVLERGPTVCLVRLIAGIECWGCGMTRAISAVLHGELGRALAFNWGVAIVFPLLAAIWFTTLWRLIRRS